MAITLSISVIWVIEGSWLQGLCALLGVLLALWMYRIPSRDKPASTRGARSKESSA